MVFKKKTALSGVSIVYGNFPVIERPSFTKTLKFPEDITELGAKNISDLHGKYTLLWTFASQDLARVNVQILAVETSISFRRNAIFRNRPMINQQDRWKRDAILESDPDIENLELQLAQAKAEKEQIQMWLNNFDRYLTALSRELSRKMNDQDRNR